MPSRKSVKWYGALYAVWLDGAITKSHERGVICPECQDGVLADIGHTLWQLGFFTDLCYEMTICNKCDACVAILSEIEHEQIVEIPQIIKGKRAVRTKKGVS